MSASVPIPALPPIRPGSWAAWQVALRPKTLWIATIPVLVATCLAWSLDGAFSAWIAAVALAGLLAGGTVTLYAQLNEVAEWLAARGTQGMEVERKYLLKAMPAEVRNKRYIDRNHGGILIVWDRLFGTFTREQPEIEPVVYGLTTNVESYNLFTVATHEYRDMFREVARSDNWRDRLGFVLRSPGWAYRRREELAGMDRW